MCMMHPHQTFVKSTERSINTNLVGLILVHCIHAMWQHVNYIQCLFKRQQYASFDCKREKKGNWSRGSRRKVMDILLNLYFKISIFRVRVSLLYMVLIYINNLSKSLIFLDYPIYPFFVFYLATHFLLISLNLYFIFFPVLCISPHSQP